MYNVSMVRALLKKHGVTSPRFTWSFMRDGSDQVLTITTLDNKDHQITVDRNGNTFYEEVAK